MLKRDVQLLDDEWIKLIQIAKSIGLSREEVRIFFRENTNEKQPIAGKYSCR